MKIWEKIYLVVIALFLLVLNTCNILIFRSSYEKSVDLVKQTAESSWKYMAISMTEDLSEIENERTAEWQLLPPVREHWDLNSGLIKKSRKKFWDWKRGRGRSQYWSGRVKNIPVRQGGLEQPDISL